MSKPKIRILDIAAFVLTVLATIVQFAGFFLPNWWSYKSDTTEAKLEYGMLFSTECSPAGECKENTAVVIEGGKEWLFLTRIFEAFGVILCLIAFIVHIVFLPTRKYAVRAASIYTLGAAGLFALAGAFLFVAKYSDLGSQLATGKEGSPGPAFGICILAGVLSLVAAVVTGVATVKKGDDYYD
ncbi:uncharacterized protein LOC127704881 [Mytilus californianus]|uniref:uncharacterized protein LOC127704881 n=1 Tax=Mytilus californianus TaxID=6549 RepID=UPI0022468168|nr:uncharacterized protein LOC127704881 [Mytilus californianus]